MNEFYVYALLDPRKPGKFNYEEFSFDHEPFYIGKGIGRRCFDHFKPSEIKRNYNPYKNRKILKIRNINKQPIVAYISKKLTENESFLLEKRVVKTIGMGKKNGPLTNLYEGGCGSPKTKEIRKKLSKSMKEWHSLHPSPRLGTKNSQEHRSKISKALKGRVLTKEWIDKMIHTKMTSSRPPNTKIWRMISPEGKEYIADGLTTFCKEHDLAPCHMAVVAGGKRRHHKGWTCTEIKEPNKISRPMEYYNIPTE